MEDQTRNPERRPSPDALLKEVQRSERKSGRLKIFLGAAPGVGKTFEMLLTAQAKRRENADIVIGVVETHGRRETQALLEGLEVVPPKRVEYKGRSFEELDLDRLIERRPDIAVIDELAHTNAPGSRHPKRYLDVEELLERGIDVYTTVNIQHIESLNDVVAQITHVRVRETVPEFNPFQGGRHRSRRSDTRGSHSAAERRKGVRSGASRSLPSGTSFRPSISPHFGSWPFGAPPTGSTSSF